MLFKPKKKKSSSPIFHTLNFPPLAITNLFFLSMRLALGVRIFLDFTEKRHPKFVFLCLIYFT